MNEEHLTFCRAHDWGRNATLSYGTIYNLKETTVTKAGKVKTRARAFSNPAALMAWAGY
jgi:hypothetical protein